MTSSKEVHGKIRALDDPHTTAVICVECQNGVLGPDSILPALATCAEAVIPGIGKLVAGARAAGVLVVHATFEGFYGAADPGAAPLWGILGPLSQDWGPGHPATRVVAGLQEPEDLVLPRHQGLSPTWGNELLPVLRGRGIRTVVLAGVSLNIALPLAAGEAVHEGFRVVIPRDAVAGTPAEYGEHMLRNTLAMLATIVTVDDAIASWSVVGA